MKPETKVKDFSRTPPPPPLSGAAILKKVNRRGDVGINVINLTSSQAS
ncbi:hypothetical protein [Ruminococcus callidus]|nr:hypothetical protein [Ruminococcus callidus]